MVDKISGESMDIVKDNILKLKQIFPEVFCEDKIDFERLQEVLGEYIDDKEEKYRFEWHGKSKAIRMAQTPSRGTLRPCKAESKNWDTTQNLYIEGDNLEVLKLLQKSYQNKVKMIYIDPPYNTGNDFVYKDDYKDNLQNYLELTGQVDDDGKKISTNSEAGGRYHTNWLNMMYPRLRLAKNLLKDDGVIFISIDDNEVSNLKKVCDEIFGESNFVTKFIWKKRTGSNDSQNGVSVDHEYILAYFRSEKAVFNGVIKTFENYKNPDNDPRGPWMSDNLTCNKTASQRPNLFYSITDPKTGITYNCNSNRVWAYEKERMERIITEDKVIFPRDGKGTPMYKRHKAEVKSDKKPYSSLVDTQINSVATKELRDTLNAQIFSYPKSVNLLAQLIGQGTNKYNKDIVLDFFSGSSTTAHAIMQLNSQNQGNRKFIMVQLPEPTDETSEAYKAGYKNICEIGKERIRRAGDKIVEENKDKEGIENLDIGFKVFKLDTSNIKTWNPDYESLEQRLDDIVDNFIPDRTEDDVVYEIMLKYGIDLTYPIKTRQVCDKNVYSIGMGALLICLDNEITLELVNAIVDLKNELKPETCRVVFKDNGFKTDSVKTNTVEILKRNNVEEIMSI
ncbi:site-specific DNA-methyltransferase [Clostridium oryzae]|uniref:Putative methyltransferase n=1 Tax=Clostridium oryzae TaxID=1450648 RepID=A0A1V4IRN0_9CLOT|nr:site-specific DNA-methyltransferase [Clostridium oryzae]OPJ62563.1 putative methyltransferase [Clostridium oryzae]